MLPARLILVRHGETDWNRTKRCQGQTDVPLNETGREQARALALSVEGWGIAALVSSDLLRASETARILGKAAEIQPHLDAAWRELHLGALEGAPHSEIPGSREIISEVARSGGPIAEGGESFARFHERLLAGYERICREHEGEIVAIVSHGGTLKALIAHLIGLDPGQVDRLSLRGNTSVSVIDYRHARPQLVLFNDTCHLEDRGR